MEHPFHLDVIGVQTGSSNLLDRDLSQLRITEELSGIGAHLRIARLGHSFRGQLNRLDNGDIAGAATEISVGCQSGFDLIRSGMRVGVQERLSCHDHTRSAEATLDCPRFDEGMLDGVQVTTLRQPLDRFDTRVFNRFHLY